MDEPSRPPRSSSPVAAARIPLADTSVSLPSALTSKIESAQSWAEERKRKAMQQARRTDGAPAPIAAAVTPEQPIATAVSEPTYNTARLGQRLAFDAAAAASAGAMVTPVIAVIDKAIIENASNRATISQSVRNSLTLLVTRPHRFVFSRPFGLIFALYTGTYLSANALDTALSTRNDKPASTTTSGTSKFVMTSATNLSLCLYKDSQYTKLFGAAGAGRPVPPVSFALFAVRDMMTVFASFNVPPVLAPMLPLGPEVERYVSRASAAQFLAPAAVQAFSTPLHLLGLDMYNRPGVSAPERMSRVARDWGKSFAARVGRIVPAFGVGGVVNSGVRKSLMQKIE